MYTCSCPKAAPLSHWHLLSLPQPLHPAQATDSSVGMSSAGLGNREAEGGAIAFPQVDTLSFIPKKDSVCPAGEWLTTGVPVAVPSALSQSHKPHSLLTREDTQEHVPRYNACWWEVWLYCVKMGEEWFQRGYLDHRWVLRKTYFRR